MEMGQTLSQILINANALHLISCTRIISVNAAGDDIVKRKDISFVRKHLGRRVVFLLFNKIIENVNDQYANDFATTLKQ